MKNAYIHIPFCSNICSYCDFTKMYYNKEYVDKYLSSLKEEIKLRYKKEALKTIYIGGGTPSSLDLQELEKLLKIVSILKKDSNYEYTFEANIDDLNEEKLKLLKTYGVNRLSIGIQSFNPKIIKILNRKHTKKQALAQINLAKKYFNNINIDLIYGVTTSLNVIKEDIDNFLKLNLPHVSVYSLIIEDHTMLKNNNFKNIDDEIEYKMYKYIEDKLTSNGYVHYEISNYAKASYESIHNLNYWDNGMYYGFGLGSVSYIDNYRIENTKNILKYLNKNYEFKKEYEDEKLRMDNKVMLSFRKLKGINIKKFRDEFKKDIFEVYNLKSLIEDEYLVLDKDNLYINHNYLYVSNEILTKILDEEDKI